MKDGGLVLKSLIKIFLFLSLVATLNACAGQGGALDGGLDGNSVGGPVGGGQGQPTIAPGADHQPGIPVEEEKEIGPGDFTAPGPEEPEEPKPGFQGAGEFKSNN